MDTSKNSTTLNLTFQISYSVHFHCVPVVKYSRNPRPYSFERDSVKHEKEFTIIYKNPRKPVNFSRGKEERFQDDTD